MDVRFTRCNPTASIATDCACSVPQANAGRALRTTMHSACKIHYRQLAQIAIGNTYQQMTQGGRNVPVRMLSESIRRGCGEERKRTRDGYPSLQGSIRIHFKSAFSVNHSDDGLSFHVSACISIGNRDDKGFICHRWFSRSCGDSSLDFRNEKWRCIAVAIPFPVAGFLRK